MVSLSYLIAADGDRLLQLHITPDFLRTKLEEWLSNKEPWCLSRQLLWGHRIPAYRIANSKLVVSYLGCVISFCLFLYAVE